MRIGSRTIIGISQLLLATIGAAQGAPRAASPLVGRWDALNRSVGGLGSTIEFGPDNTLSFTIGAMLDFTYRRSGDTLFVMHPDGDLPAARVAIEGDTLIVTTNGKEQRETRIGAAVSGDPLVGLWTYPHYTGVPAYEQYTSKGELHLRVPIRTLQGTYVAVGDSAMLHLLGDGGGDRAVRFAVAGDTLQLTWDGQSTRYLKGAPLSR
jgi:hypothetical protein